jgi:hypothetical protein
VVGLAVRKWWATCRLVTAFTVDEWASPCERAIRSLQARGCLLQTVVLSCLARATRPLRSEECRCHHNTRARCSLADLRHQEPSASRRSPIADGTIHRGDLRIAFTEYGAQRSLYAGTCLVGSERNHLSWVFVREIIIEHTFRTLPGNLVAIQLRWRSVSLCSCLVDLVCL